MITAKIALTKIIPEFYQLEAKNAAGDGILFNQFKGKTILIVNTALPYTIVEQILKIVGVVLPVGSITARK